MRRKIVMAGFAICLAPMATVWAVEEALPRGDITAGKAIATSCAACHGAQGISSQPGVPHIAGQSAAYVQVALIAYQKGIRKDEDMQKAAAVLNAQGIADLASYYESLPHFNSRPADSGALPPPNIDEDPFAAVKKLTAMCAGCHGEDGNSKASATPSLAGQNDAYLTAAMEAYQGAKRVEPMMQALTKPLERSQIEDIAYFYAAMVPAPAAVPDKGDPLAGIAISTPCAGCHGVDGNSADPKNPRLAGLGVDYLVTAIKAYQEGTRESEVMRNQVLALRDHEVLDLAAYYASKEPQALPIRKPLTLAEWTARCNRCHGQNGNSTDPRFPILAGQDEDYLAKALEKYHRGTRDNQLMFAMSFLMGKSDIEKLAAYYTQQRKD